MFIYCLIFFNAVFISSFQFYNFGRDKQNVAVNVSVVPNAPYLFYSGCLSSGLILDLWCLSSDFTLRSCDKCAQQRGPSTRMTGGTTSALL